MSDAERGSEPKGGQITLRYWASAKSAAGVETDVVEAPRAQTLESLVEESIRRHGGSARLADVLACCSVLVGDRPVASEDRSAVLVEPGSRVEFLPPFAGG